MTPPAQPQTPWRWAKSSLDHRAHLLWPDGDHPKGVLLAQCGEPLPTNVP